VYIRLHFISSSAGAFMRRMRVMLFVAINYHSSYAPFCSVLYSSSIRGLATPWTYFLHLSLSSVILIDSSTGSLSTSWCCPSRPCVVFLACVHLAFLLALSLSPGNSLVSSWCDHSMLVSLLWQCLTVLSLLQLCWEPTHLFSLLSMEPAPWVSCPCSICEAFLQFYLLHLMLTYW